AVFGNRRPVLGPRVFSRARADRGSPGLVRGESTGLMRTVFTHEPLARLALVPSARAAQDVLPCVLVPERPPPVPARRPGHRLRIGPRPHRQTAQPQPPDRVVPKRVASALPWSPRWS